IAGVVVHHREVARALGDQGIDQLVGNADAAKAADQHGGAVEDVGNGSLEAVDCSVNQDAVSGLLARTREYSGRAVSSRTRSVSFVFVLAAVAAQALDLHRRLGAMGAGGLEAARERRQRGVV